MVAWNTHDYTPVATAIEQREIRRAAPIGRFDGLPPNFEPEALLGEGGTASVYRARWYPSNQVVALKVSRPDASPSMLRSMRREASLGESLNHTGFAKVFAFGRFFSRVWIAEEFIDGIPLHDLLPCLSFTAVRRIAVLTRIASHLEHLHSRGWVHRDVKGGNVLLARRGPVLIDLGLARRPQEPEPAGTLLCTPRCVPPEVVSGERYDHRADIFQLGVMAYELMCTEFPWVADKPLRTAIAVCTRMPTPFPEVVRPDLGLNRRQTKLLGKLTQSCLHRDPHQRPASARHVANALEALL